jgi:hypothetical protein
MADLPDRGPSSTLRGWLSEVYLAALTTSDVEQLARRLGDRASVDDPLFGHATGDATLVRELAKAAEWLAEHQAHFEKAGLVLGSDLDITEGLLKLTVGGEHQLLPVAIVAERRREREVDLRVYYSTKSLGRPSRPRAALLPEDDAVAVPPPVQTYLDALARGDVTGIVASFENGATVRAPDGRVYTKLEGGGALRAQYERLVAADGGESAGGMRVLKNARADDGRACVLEYTVVRMKGRDISPQPGVAVFERGESGLLRAARIYDDVV